MLLNIFSLFTQETQDSTTSLFVTVVSLAITISLVLAFKSFVLKSQQGFRQKFESEGYNFDKSWKFPQGMAEIDTQKNILWFSSHGNKLIDINTIDEIKLIKSVFEISNIYIRTDKEVLKYPVSSARRTSKTKLDERDSMVNKNVEEIKEYIFSHQNKEASQA